MDVRAIQPDRTRATHSPVDQHSPRSRFCARIHDLSLLVSRLLDCTARSSYLPNGYTFITTVLIKSAQCRLYTSTMP